jgi:hypothetical protein
MQRGGQTRAVELALGEGLERLTKTGQDDR